MFELAARISKIVWNDEDLLFISQHLATLKDREADFFAYCATWKLAPWTYVQLKKHELLELLKPQTTGAFKKAHEKIEEQNERRNQTAAEFLAEFKKEAIEVVVLKGNYLAHTAYHSIGYKRMNDFDILIHQEDWSRIQDVYLRLGYIPLGFGWSGEKEKPATFSHVGMSFISSDFSCIIGSQWGLKSPTTHFKVDIDEAWASSKDFDFYGVPVKSLSPEYNLVHLILHLGVFKCGIRDCMDLYNLHAAEPINEAELLRIIKSSNATEKAYFALEISNLCTPIFSPFLIDKLATNAHGFLGRRLHKRKKVASETGDFQTSYNDYFQDIEKKVIYFNLFPQFHVKLKFYLKILRMIYFPKMKTALKMNDAYHQPTVMNKVVSVLKAPYFVFSLIAQEIGWKFTILLFIKLGVDLLISVKNYFVKTSSYFDYLKSKGIDPKEIEKAVKNIQ